MTTHPFHKKLLDLRQKSRWPDADEFSIQIGSSLGGYKKYETGERIPSQKVLARICKALRLNDEATAELQLMRDEAKAQQVGITRSFDQKPPVNVDALATKLQNEVSYVLKQDGVKVTRHLAKVIEGRFIMILRSTLGE